jgi:hypothetical protein
MRTLPGEMRLSKSIVNIFTGTAFLVLSSFISLQAQRTEFSKADVADVSLSSSNSMRSPIMISDNESSLTSQSMMLLRRGYRDPGIREKRMGSMLMKIGFVMAAGGGILYARSEKGVLYTQTAANGQTTNYYDVKYVGGIVMMTVGTAGLMLPGFLIRQRGIRLNTRYLEEQQKLSFHFYGTGGSLTYKF